MDATALIAAQPVDGRDTQLPIATRTRAILAASAGNLVEWYDFYVYAFTALYFSAKFFPTSDRLSQIMATSGIFAAGFFMRPIGAWYFGRYADRRGRRAAMMLAVLMMGCGSLAIGLLPTYSSIGVAAPALLLLGRLVQGFSTGGEYGAAATYLSEVAGARRRGFWASFQYVTLIGGQLCATLVLLLLQQFLSESAMSEFGWRIPFLLGGVAAVGVLLLRRQMPETMRSEGRHPRAGSLSELLTRNGRAFATVVALTAGGSLSFYTFTTYMQKYLVLTVGLGKATATAIMSAVLLFFMLQQPLMGLLSDRIGRRNNMLLFAGLATVLTIPILAALGRVHDSVTAALLVLAGLTINSFYTSVSGLFKAEMFPIHVRALGVGLAYGVGNALFGGTAENVALALKAVGTERLFAWYVTAICAVSLLAALTLKDTRRDNVLDEVGM